MTMRYEVKLIGSFGVQAIDHLQASTSYTELITDDLHSKLYKGLRLLVPYLFPHGNFESAPSQWMALPELEALYKVVFILVPSDMSSDSGLKKNLTEFDSLTRSVLGWNLLPVVFDVIRPFSLQNAFEAILQSIHKLHQSTGVPHAQLNATTIVRTPIVDTVQLKQTREWASLEYTAKDYARKRKASFIEYYATNPLEGVLKVLNTSSSRRIDGIQLEERIIDAIEKRIGFSFVRLGEGEGCFLSYGKYLNDRSSNNEVLGVCAKDIYRIWFDKNIHDLNLSQYEELCTLILQAVLNCDVLGLPTAERAIFEYSHFVTDMDLHGFSRGYIGVSEVIGYAKELVHSIPSNKIAFADCDISRPLYPWQKWDESLATTLPRILTGRGEVTLVTCHQELGGRLKKSLNLRNVQTINIPPEKGRVFGKNQLPGDHYNEYFFQVIDSLRRNASPIVLVAAGFLGKAYCTAAREAGSVAIDIGSLADFWAGVNTRQKNSWGIPSPFFSA